MTKLCIVDLDGVVADNTERFKRAEEAKAEYLDGMARADLIAGTKHEWNTVKQEATNLYWQTAFDPALVSLDTLIDGVPEALEVLDRHNWQILYVTSRPESMRQATVEWLNDNSLYGWSLVDFPGFLIMKAPAFQYVKTVVWKAGMVQTLAMLYGADKVLFIDDEAANAAEVMNHAEAVEYQIRVCSSLQKAVEAQS